MAIYGTSAKKTFVLTPSGSCQGKKAAACRGALSDGVNACPRKIRFVLFRFAPPFCRFVSFRFAGIVVSFRFATIVDTHRFVSFPCVKVSFRTVSFRFLPLPVLASIWFKLSLLFKWMA